MLNVCNRSEELKHGELPSLITARMPVVIVVFKTPTSPVILSCGNLDVQNGDEELMSRKSATMLAKRREERRQ